MVIFYKKCNKVKVYSEAKGSSITTNYMYKGIILGNMLYLYALKYN